MGEQVGGEIGEVCGYGSCIGCGWEGVQWCVCCLLVLDDVGMQQVVDVECIYYVLFVVDYDQCVDLVFFYQLGCFYGQFVGGDGFGCMVYQVGD